MGTGDNKLVHELIYNHITHNIKHITNCSMFHVPCSKREKGITLIEIVVVIFIIALFSSILLVNFPKIRRQFALTRAVYKMSQDLRRAQDMGLSGQRIEGGDVKGYGVYINLTSLGNKKYIMYADMNDDQRYTGQLQEVCGQQQGQQQGAEDCIIETINLSQAESGVIINSIKVPTDVQQVDINFKPPNPTVTITSLSSGNRVQIIFALESDLLTYRTVSVNTSGLIEIK